MEPPPKFPLEIGGLKNIKLKGIESMNKFWWIANPFDGYYYKCIPVRGIKNPNKVKAYKRLPKNIKEISAQIGYGFLLGNTRKHLSPEQLKVSDCYSGYKTIPIRKE